MSKPWKPGKKTVELKPEARVSRIRRDPVHVKEAKAESEKRILFQSDDREIWIAIIGIVAFAIAINIITIAISAYSN
jgi:hypothetical protein